MPRAPSDRHRFFMAYAPPEAMDHGDCILRIVTMANHGAGLMKASEAVRVIAALIDRLDKSCESYAQEMEALLRIGATVWSHEQPQCPPRQRETGAARKTLPALR